jgi:hypothetical protein
LYENLSKFIVELIVNVIPFFHIPFNIKNFAPYFLL